MRMSMEEFARLRERVEAYQFDRPDEAIDFTGRLRKETGWSAARAGRALFEYRRFVMLAAACEHMVSPSEAVDRIWHLHLTETRRYWDEFCPQVLQYPLHHEPSRGGAEEEARFAELYRRTLEAYAQAFGEAPPPDIWPAPDRPRLFSRAARALKPAVALPLLAAVAGCEALYNSSAPGAIPGPQFIVGYVAACLIGLVVMGLWQSRAAMHHDSPVQHVDLGSYELAYLAGGPRRVLETAVYQLVQAGRLVLADGGRRIDKGAEPPADAPPVERAVYDAAGGKRLKLSTPGLRTALVNLRNRLRTGGLVPTSGATATIWIIALAIFGPLLALAFLRLHYGQLGHKPIGFLVMAMVVAPMLALGVTQRSLGVNGAGRKAVAQAKAALPKTRASDPSDPLALRALAILGVAGLAALDLQDYRRFVAAQPWAQSASDGGSSSSGCGGGGGCGGGCGG
jgi:uncharacterized protein (TIGR04222 family)